MLANCRIVRLTSEVSISSKSINIVENPDISPFMPRLSAYPNPTSDIVFIEYNLEYSEEDGMEHLLEALGKLRMDNCERGIIKLYSSDSRILYTHELNLAAGILNIDLSNYPSDIYIIEISDCNGNVNSLKIVKTE